MWNKCIFFYILITNIYLVKCGPGIENSKMETKELPKNPPELNLLKMLQKTALVGNNTAKKRVKRQGSGKFSEAADMTEMKTFRLFLQMFRNLWARTYVGGGHPLHPDVPKPVLLLFKQKIMGTFFPDDAKQLES